MDVLKNFNYDVLNSPEYGEDSVREEIVFPIIRSLGYSSDGNNRIVRSRKLLHPFVSIGSQKRKISIIPDYIMEIDGKPCWIMEAKAPDQDILNTSYAEQAYSYAIHSEIRAFYYALCNGKEFLLYHVSEYKPLLHFNIKFLSSHWKQLEHFLSPQKIYKNLKLNLNKDFGLHLKRLGFDTPQRLIFLDVPIAFIAKLDNDLYTFSPNINEDGITYCASFDFNHEVLLQLQGKIPDAAIDILKKPFDNEIIEVRFGDKSFNVNVECNLNGKLVENKNEIFLPLTIGRIIK